MTEGIGVKFMDEIRSRGRSRAPVPEKPEPKVTFPGLGTFPGQGVYPASDGDA